MYVRMLLTLVVLAVLLTPMRGESREPRRVALLLGNWDYNLNGQYDKTPSPQSMADLEYPCSDTALIGKRLSEFGFEVSEHCNTSRDQFREVVGGFFKELGTLPDYSIVFVYYSGHGVQQRTSVFSIPVGFTDAPSDTDDVNSLLTHYENHANNIRFITRLLPRGLDIANILVLDNCRSQIAVEDERFHDALVSINMPVNTLVQYAVSATREAQDNGRFAQMLAEELAVGDQIYTAIGRVDAKIWNEYRSGMRETYSDSDAGQAFKSLSQLAPLRDAPPSSSTEYATASATEAPEPEQPLAYAANDATESSEKYGGKDEPKDDVATKGRPIPSVERVEARDIRKRVLSGYRGNHPTVDVLWCVGPGDKQRLEHATYVARTVSSHAEDFGVGMVRTVPLSEEMNKPHNSYNVHMNLMRYDVSQKNEYPLLRQIAAEFPEYGFLPYRGIGVGGRPTPNYVSIFICGDQPQNIPNH